MQNIYDGKTLEMNVYAHEYVCIFFFGFGDRKKTMPQMKNKWQKKREKKMRI